MRWLRVMRSWLSATIHHEREEAEVSEEIRFHVEMDVSRSMSQGLTREEAIRRAAMRFGNMEAVRQRTRDQRKSFNAGEIMRDFAYALRSFRRTPGFTFVALATLAVGIGATTLAFTLVNSVLLKPLPYRQSDRLVMVSELDNKGERLWPSYPNFIDWRSQAHSFDGVASFMFPFGASAQGTGDVLRVKVMGVSDGFFRVLGVKPEIGREFTTEESSARDGKMRVVMVTHEFWEAQLGAQRDLSQVRLRANGGAVSVIGVLPAGFHIVADADLFFPHEIWPGTIRSAHNYVVIGRLARGSSLESARADMQQLSRRLKAQYGDETQAAAAELVTLREFIVGDQAHALLLLLGAAVLVLFIACLNLISAQLARGTVRQREIAVRAALGAGRARIVRQLLVESLVLSGIGAVAGVVIAFMLLNVLRVAAATMIPRIAEVGIDTRVLLFAMGVAGLSVVVTGVYPSLRLSNRGIRWLASRGMQSGSEHRSAVWSLLIGSEVALAVVLLIGSTLLVRSLHNILRMNPGFDAAGVVAVTMTPGDETTLEQLENIESQLRALPGVESAGMSNVLPLQWGNWYGPVLRTEDRAPQWAGMAGFRVISPTYFDALRLPVVRGRQFTSADRAGSPRVMIITKPLADRLWPGQDPIGKQLKTNYVSDAFMTIVGVVPEAQNWQDVGQEQNEVYTPIAQNAGHAKNGMSVVLRTRAASDPSIAGVIRQRLRAIAPDMPVTIETMTERIENTAKDRRFAMMVLTGFAAVALALAALGIYGVVSYSVAVRTREIGVRMALGATSASVLAETAGRAGFTAGIGVIAGMLAGVAATRTLQSLLFGVAPLDRISFVSSAAILLCTAIAAALIPAYQSSRTDPLVSLRAD